jgi:hypothetical protein
MDTEQSTSKYSKYHKKYYDQHREEIRVKRKPTDKAYYEANKEKIKQRALDRYYRLKDAATPAAQPAAGETPAERETA